MTTQTEETQPLPITEHELIALVALANTPAALTCQTLFRLDHVAGAPLEQAGVTTLLERGLLTIDQNALLPVGPAVAVTGVLAESDSWLEVALVTPEAEHVYFLFGSDHGALVLSLSKYGVHELRPLVNIEGMFTTAIEMVNYYLGTSPDGLPAAATLRRHLGDKRSHAVHLKAEPDGSLAIAHGEGEDLPSAPVAKSDLGLKIREGLSLHSA
ncbi:MULTISPECIES: hypothetical protein [Arthrobacter]|uniref:Uncharacterized protein n=2 Tax=Arthrobacter TaxID=1663 RepID=A0ABU9KK62_9MICC|nr:hypothetical protein [Arthrobacter sp. YJM1]MDP5227046.1 hypothetical protein [Arthrobacter sp. YJM1]